MKEPEEIIEELMVGVLSNALPDIDTIGALSPVPEGEQKKSADTYIAVFVDLEEPLNAFKSPLMPCTYSLRITVHYANADDTIRRNFCWAGCAFAQRRPMAAWIFQRGASHIDALPVGRRAESGLGLNPPFGRRNL